MPPLTSKEFLADVAAIYRSGPEPSFGSGRLIAPGLVLTADHVVTLKKAGAVDTGWKLRLIRDRPDGRDAQWGGEAYTATVVWRGGNGLDLALLRLEGEVQAPLLGNLIFASYDLAGPLSDVRCAGFPEAMRDADSRAFVYKLEGDLDFTTPKMPFAWTVPQEKVPRDPKRWQGMSGAAVGVEGPSGGLHVFGVVESVKTNFSGGMLDVAPLSDAFADESFHGILSAALEQEPQLTPWNGAPGPPAAAPSTFPSPLAGVIHLFDRQAPAEYIDGLIGPGPIEFLLGGHDDDMLDLFVRRIEERTLTSRDRQAQPAGASRAPPIRREVVPIEWTGVTRPRMRFISARTGLRRLGATDTAETDLGRALHRGLHQPGQAAWVDLRIDARLFGDGDVKPLQDWRQFWRDARAVGDLPPCGVIYSISGVTDTLTPSLAQAFGPLADELLLLAPCNGAMVRGWADDLQGWGAAASLIEAACDLDRRFRPNSFRLRTLDDYLKTGKLPPP